MPVEAMKMTIYDHDKMGGIFIDRDGDATTNMSLSLINK